MEYASREGSRAPSSRCPIWIWASPRSSRRPSSRGGATGEPRSRSSISSVDRRARRAQGPAMMATPRCREIAGVTASGGWEASLARVGAPAMDVGLPVVARPLVPERGATVQMVLRSAPGVVDVVAHVAWRRRPLVEAPGCGRRRARDESRRRSRPRVRCARIRARRRRIDRRRWPPPAMPVIGVSRSVTFDSRNVCRRPDPSTTRSRVRPRP